MRLTPRGRKALLTLHVATAVGWLGVDLVQLTLGAAGLTGHRPDVVYPAIGLIGQVLFVPLSVLVWVVGVVSAAVTPWGLLRHRWGGGEAGPHDGDGAASGAGWGHG